MSTFKCKIHSGKLKGRFFTVWANPKNIRPTTQKNRQSLFNILGASIIEASFLDLFCGTAAMTFEAYSRGAAYCVGIDNSKILIRNAKKSKEDLGIGENIDFICRDVNNVLKLEHQFDFIFVDPPYDETKYPSTSYYQDLLKPEGVIIMEHRKNFIPTYSEDCLKKIDQRDYGDSVYSIYRNIRN